jgi:hypothetical protein
MFGPDRLASSKPHLLPPRTHVWSRQAHLIKTSLTSSAHTCLVQVGALHQNLTNFFRSHMFGPGPGRRASSKPHSLPPRTHVSIWKAHLIAHVTRFLHAHMFGPGRRTSLHISLASSAHTCLVQVGAPHLNLTQFLRAHMFGPGPGRRSSPHTSLASSTRTCLVQVCAAHHTSHAYSPCTHLVQVGKG